MDVHAWVFYSGVVTHFLFLIVFMVFLFRLRRTYVFLTLKVEALFWFLVFIGLSSQPRAALDDNLILVVGLYCYLRCFAMFTQILGNPEKPKLGGKTNKDS